MIIKKIVITNFRSYYGENTFELSKGLTLIIGGNGDGKTTFFEALEWLLNTSLEIKELSNVSEMRKSELAIGEVDTMSVSMLFEHNGEKEVTKSLTFEKMSDGNCKVTNYSFRGYETDGAERMLRTGKSLIDSCFDSYIRRYCLFKGESQLNVFNEPTALKTLVDKFSDIRKFEDFVEVASDLEQKSETAYTKECKSDTFSLQNIHAHQVDFMSDFEKQSGISFLLIYFTTRDVCYYLNFEQLQFFWERAKKGGRKSFRFDELQEEYLLPKKQGVLIPFLEPLQLDLTKRT